MFPYYFLASTSQDSIFAFLPFGRSWNFAMIFILNCIDRHSYNIYLVNIACSVLQCNIKNLILFLVKIGPHLPGV